LNRGKRILPISKMLHELERAEEADEDEQDEGQEDRERARKEELG
jgi:hypothetical protein